MFLAENRAFVLIRFSTIETNAERLTYPAHPVVSIPYDVL
jgi:hypothetical protein